MDVRGWPPVKRHPATFGKFDSYKTRSGLYPDKQTIPRALFYYQIRRRRRSNFDVDVYPKEETADYGLSVLAGVGDIKVFMPTLLSVSPRRSYFFRFFMMTSF